MKKKPLWKKRRLQKEQHHLAKDHHSNSQRKLEKPVHPLPIRYQEEALREQARTHGTKNLNSRIEGKLKKVRTEKEPRREAMAREEPGITIHTKFYNRVKLIYNTRKPSQQLLQ